MKTPIPVKSIPSRKRPIPVLSIFHRKEWYNYQICFIFQVTLHRSVAVLSRLDASVRRSSVEDYTSTGRLMDPRHQQFRPSPDFRKKETTDANDAESPLAAERFSRAADRITRKIDKVPLRKAPPDRFNTLRLIGIGIITLAVVAIVETIVQYRLNHSPAVTPATVTVHRTVHPSIVSPAPVQVQRVPPRDTSVATSSRNRPAVTADNRGVTPYRSASAGNPSGHRPGSRQTPGEKYTAAPATDTPSPADSSPGDDEPDDDHTIAFYEPVSRSTKSGSFNLRSGSGDRIQGHATSVDATNKPGKRSCIKITASLAAKAGGKLDEVLEHNGTYYKVKLTLPVKRIEYFKKSLAVQEAVAMLSVTAESTRGGTSVIILEMNTR
jgi:hypothetical protein